MSIPDLDQLRGASPEELKKIIARTDEQLLDLHQKPDGSLRELNGGEQAEWDKLMSFRSRAILKADTYGQVRSAFERGGGRNMEVAGGQSLRGGPDPEYGTRSPLAYQPQALDGLQAALDERTTGRFSAFGMEQRAALTTSTYGAPRVWGANILAGPRILHVVAGVPRQPSNAILAQVPNFTLPAGAAGVAENASLAEFAASTAGSVTLARFGRYTDLSRESTIGTSADSLVGLHQIGISHDLDLLLITAVNTAAGSAVAFTADVPAAIRKSLATVADNTAASATDLVIMANPADASLLQDVTPVGGATIGEPFQQFSGALVYPSSAVPTGFMLVGNLAAGVRYFEAQGTVTETQVASIKTGTLTVATSTISGYGLILAGGATGAFQKVDVVTP